MNEMIADHVAELHNTKCEDAYHALIEVDDSMVPQIIDAYRSQNDAGVRAILVETIWQHRLPSTISFLIEALHDSENDVWRSALDGIVTIHHPKRIELLDEEIKRLRSLSHPKRYSSRIEWIEEAIDQIKLQ